MLYNSLWTSLTCLFAYALERDVPYNETLKFPLLYEAGQKKQYFSYGIFWKWVILAVFHGFIIFFGCSYGFRGVIDNSGKTEDLWFASTIAFSCIIHLVTGKLAIELIFLNWIVIIAGIGSVVFYWLFVIVFNTAPFSQAFQPEIEEVYFRILSNLKAWIVIIFLPIIALLPDMSIKYFFQMYKPSVSDSAIASVYGKKSSFFDKNSGKLHG
jgi:magnesium-transporting ATPase (P-type)